MLTRLLLALLRFYRLCISPYMFVSCRFVPTCSVYASEAIERFGPAKGLRLAAWRLLKCHPFHPGGYDPVVKSSVQKESNPLKR